MGKRKQVQVPMGKIKEQDRFIEVMKEYTSRYEAEHGRKPAMITNTFGCAKVSVIMI